MSEVRIFEINLVVFIYGTIYRNVSASHFPFYLNDLIFCQIGIFPQDRLTGFDDILVNLKSTTGT